MSLSRKSRTWLLLSRNSMMGCKSSGMEVVCMKVARSGTRETAENILTLPSATGRIGASSNINNINVSTEPRQAVGGGPVVTKAPPRGASRMIS